MFPSDRQRAGSVNDPNFPNVACKLTCNYSCNHIQLYSACSSHHNIMCSHGYCLDVHTVACFKVLPPNKYKAKRNLSRIKQILKTQDSTVEQRLEAAKACKIFIAKSNRKHHNSILFVTESFT